MYVWEARLTDSSGIETLLDTDSVVVQVISTNAELGPIGGLICVESMSITRPSAIRERMWYKHSAEALEEVAYQNPGNLPVVHMRLYGRSYRVRPPSVLDPTSLWATSPLTDSIQWREEPRIVLRYPLTTGSRWTAISTPFLQTREVTGISERRISDGRRVQAAMITTVSSLFGPEDSWLDDISSIGMLGRSLRMHIDVYDQNMVPAGRAWYTETLSLVSLSG